MSEKKPTVRKEDFPWICLEKTKTKEITITLTVMESDNGSILHEYGKRGNSDHGRVILTGLDTIPNKDWQWFIKKAVGIDITNNDREIKERKVRAPYKEYLSDRLRENQTKGPENAPKFDFGKLCSDKRPTDPKEKDLETEKALQIAKLFQDFTDGKLTIEEFTAKSTAINAG